ncbi:DUF5723 family protein [Bacteroides sp. GD17]|jgi:hypothetical protein|uniref:DUF5723 family protein n=1 Tax=Bacteroides sp. GD17 TaxID=3139826 RepID=UPI00313A83B8
MRNLSSLKVWLSVALLLCISLSGQAQFLRTSYFMEGSSQRMQLNPALMPGRGYVNLPVIGSLNATVNSGSLGYQDIMDIIDNSDDSDYFMNNAFMNRLDATNNLNVNLSTDILSAGWYKGRNFWSVNVGVRNDIGASIPKTMFQFLNDMNSREFGDNITDYLGIDHTINGEKLEINSYAEIGLGFARNINDRLAVGGKVKMLLGIGNLKLNIDKIHVETPSVSSSGITTKASIQVDATLENSSKLLELPENEYGDDRYIDDIDFGSFGFAGYGGAIDLGASYKLTDKLTLSASILDLGFIKWSKSNTSVARATSNQTYDLLDPSSLQEFVDVVNSGEVLNFDMLQLKTEESDAKSRTRSLTSTLVLGAEYALLNDWLVVGALYTGRFAKPKTLNELTFSACIRPKNYFNVAASYSVLQGAGKTMGLAVKLGSFFVGTDYMFFGKNTKNVNAYLGVSIPLSKQKTAKNL